MVFTVQERIFIVKSYIRNRSYETTKEEFKQRYDAGTCPWDAFLFEDSEYSNPRPRNLTACRETRFENLNTQVAYGLQEPQMHRVKKPKKKL
jgi:hypothetical protein